MNPVVSAALTEAGVMVSVASSYVGVRSPLRSRMAGWRFVSGAPLQSVNFTLTGRTWPFLSLSVTGWLVIGARKEPVPTSVTVVAVSYPPSSSVTLSDVDLHPAEANVWVTPENEGVVRLVSVWLSGDPSG